jgi:hypothetical protein
MSIQLLERKPFAYSATLTAGYSSERKEARSDGMIPSETLEPLPSRPQADGLVDYVLRNY